MASSTGSFGLLSRVRAIATSSLPPLRAVLVHPQECCSHQQIHDGLAGIAHDLLTGGFWVGECDNAAHGSAEQQRVLGDDADLTTQGIQLNLSDVITIDQFDLFGSYRRGSSFINVLLPLPL